ncbi:ubiquitin carboxyl-terminal hydrolase 16-like, partial [Nannochloropsis oceanica]
RSSRASCRQRRLPITIATDHLSIKLPLSSSSSSSSSSMPG